jgi:mannose-6-phosphate isomerase-like protein (cupin superfamily)
MAANEAPRKAVVLPPGGGRDWPLGLMRATFKADGVETRNAYSISEWWMEPRSPGPGPHVHEGDDDVFYVLEGTVTFLLDGEEIEAPKGSFVLVPAGVRHDYENRTHEKAGFLNFYSGPFEADMPMIADWYKQNPAQPLS